jgi:hypothetical protein
MTAVSVWGNMGNQAYALPMVSLTPAIPSTQAYLLAWSTDDQALAYVPASIDATGNINTAGSINVAAGKLYSVAGVQVVATRRTGWGAPTGTPARGAFNSDTATLQEVARRLHALIDDLTTHGLIGA